MRDSGSAPGDADTSLQLHHYHAQCRERAARTIQAFLLKQQQQSDAAQAGAASGDLRGGDARWASLTTILDTLATLQLWSG